MCQHLHYYLCTGDTPTLCPDCPHGVTHTAVSPIQSQCLILPLTLLLPILRLPVHSQGTAV